MADIICYDCTKLLNSIRWMVLFFLSILVFSGADTTATNVNSFGSYLSLDVVTSNTIQIMLFLFVVSQDPVA